MRDERPRDRRLTVEDGAHDTRQARGRNALRHIPGRADADRVEEHLVARVVGQENNTDSRHAAGDLRRRADASAAQIRVDKAHIRLVPLDRIHELGQGLHLRHDFDPVGFERHPHSDERGRVVRTDDNVRRLATRSPRVRSSHLNGYRKFRLFQNRTLRTF